MDSFGFGAGELGWELFHKNEHTAELYEALLTAGDHHGIGDFGTYALNSLRLEKGFRSWGFEVFYNRNLLNVISFSYPNSARVVQVQPFPASRELFVVYRRLYLKFVLKLSTWEIYATMYVRSQTISPFTFEFCGALDKKH